MGLDDLVNKATDALGGEEATEDKIDQAAEFLKDKAPAQHESTIDKIAGAAKDHIDTNGR
ncbi:Rv0909 family putative TA system antitoxin [Serinibacter salmoneus]|uniref:Antitoxin protein of toxin-antitoxin system n=1 Tax=Serinibacter salmoneus TaxID=556530 RepID=A0A2A9D5A5_9MICO|nr:Rv0909 family putative TA system antitoxin [Serinibacter salmoneus]PFG21040.1 antitoxin protein of toxin-antitoxin system [Serinibacter salmoneus]